MNFSIRRMLRYYYLKTVKEKGTPDYIARGWSIGWLANWLVPAGLQIIFALSLAFLLKGSKIGAVLGTAVTNWATIVFLYPFQCYLGSLVLGKNLTFEFFRHAMKQAIVEQTLDSIWELSREILVCFFIGGLVITLVTTPLFYFAVRALVIRFRALQAARRLEKIARSRREELILIADRASSRYHCDEPVRFVLNGSSAPDRKFHYKIREWEIPLEQGEVLFDENGRAVLTGRLSHPGFLLCEVTGEGNETKPCLCGVAVDPGKIRPISSEPPDFDRFWAEGLELQAARPEITLTEIEEASCDRYRSYYLEVPTIDGRRIWGFLSVPAGPGPFPAHVEVPGAGPGYCDPDVELAARGVIALRMNVHEFRPPRGDSAALKKLFDEHYGDVWYLQQNTDDRDAYLYRRSHLGVSRAIDYLASMPEYDGRHLVVSGASQGGTYAVAMAALNRHVTAAAAMVPGFGDHGGFPAGRGKSHILLPSLKNPEKKEAMLRTAGYFDSCFFARRIRVPVLFSAGFIDDICTPGSVYAIYNEVAALKSMIDMPVSGHQMSEEARAKWNAWVTRRLGLHKQS